MRNKNIIDEFMKQNNLNYGKDFFIQCKDKSKLKFRIFIANDILYVVRYNYAVNKWVEALHMLFTIMFDDDYIIVREV